MKNDHTSSVLTGTIKLLTPIQQMILHKNIHITAAVYTHRPATLLGTHCFYMVPKKVACVYVF